MNGKQILDLCVSAAWEYQLLTWPNPAVGAAVVDEKDALLCVAAHQKAGAAHAEVLALKQAYLQLTRDTRIEKLDDANALHTFLIAHAKDIFHSCILYVTLEPCMHVGKTPACAALIQKLGFKQVYVGAKDPNTAASGAIEAYKNITYLPHVGSAALLYPFTVYQRQKRLEFFKLAQRLDGSVQGGTITTGASRSHMHRLRSQADLLVVGGQTVRTDRPTLDARLVNGRAPHVMIYSKQRRFDTSIACFNVPERNVLIHDTLAFDAEQELVMYEGGLRLLEAVLDRIELILCYVNVSLQQQRELHTINARFELLHTQQIGDDILLWMRKAQ